MCVPSRATHARDAAQALGDVDVRRSRAAPRRRSRPPRPRGGSRGYVCCRLTALTRVRFSAWILRCARRAARERQRRRRVRQRLEVREVLAQDRERAQRRRSARRGRERPTSPARRGPQALERREVGVAAAGLGQPRDLDRREEVAADERRRAHGIRRSPSRPRCGPRSGSSSSSRGADLERARAPAAPGAGRATAGAGARRSARRRSRAARAAAAPGSPAGARRSSRRTPSAASGNARRPSRWSQSPCVHSRPEQRQPACSQRPPAAPRARAGSTGESMTKHSRRPVGTGRGGRSCSVVCQNALRTTRTSAWRPTTRMRGATRRRAAWPPRASVLTSAVGFFWPESSSSLRRLTQITGTFALMHGSTSW